MAMVKFVKVLRIEMEDLEADLEFLVAENYRRQEAHEESERVCLENVATLRNEALGVQHFVEILDGVEVDNFDNLDHLVATIRQRCHDVITRRGLAEAASAYADRKIAKVEAYMTDSS
ncbi:MAG: hypothetical protein HN919_21600 [Verrucomicrobia bacterium]|nr:hypothetical protein [Verrucomicrobiota bacterium]MBT7068906.1 hypothetical protein [Verrucomicrobiota bacterium]MBT7699677.1 hypothetical protein [Verrucomicrobiota bacterium]